MGPSAMAEGERPCPGCGYDLRATAEPRCPECGEAFDVAGVMPSRIPWVRRGEIGWARAMVRTMWMVVRHPEHLFFETLRPADEGAARGFQWGVTALPAVLVGGLLAWLTWNIPAVEETYLVNVRPSAWLDLLGPVVSWHATWGIAAFAALLTAWLPRAANACFLVVPRGMDGSPRLVAVRVTTLARYASFGASVALGGFVTGICWSYRFSLMSGNGLKVDAMIAAIGLAWVIGLGGLFVMAGGPLLLLWKCRVGFPRFLLGGAVLAAQYALQLATAAALALWLPGYAIMAWRAWRP